MVRSSCGHGFEGLRIGLMWFPTACRAASWPSAEQSPAACVAASGESGGNGGGPVERRVLPTRASNPAPPQDCRFAAPTTTEYVEWVPVVMTTTTPPIPTYDPWRPTTTPPPPGRAPAQRQWGGRGCSVAVGGNLAQFFSGTRPHMCRESIMQYSAMGGRQHAVCLSGFCVARCRIRAEQSRTRPKSVLFDPELGQVLLGVCSCRSVSLVSGITLPKLVNNGMDFVELGQFRPESNRCRPLLGDQRRRSGQRRSNDSSGVCAG